jgi:hypothetical protein
MKNYTISKVIGFAPNNSMAQVNGMDEIDKWAENVGVSRKKIQKMTSVARGKKQKTITKL